MRIHRMVLFALSLALVLPKVEATGGLSSIAENAPAEDGASNAPIAEDCASDFAVDVQKKEYAILLESVGNLKKGQEVTLVRLNDNGTAVVKSTNGGEVTVQESILKPSIRSIPQNEQDQDLITSIMQILRGIQRSYNDTQTFKHSLNKKNKLRSRISNYCDKQQQIMRSFKHIEMYDDDGDFVKTQEKMWKGFKALVAFTYACLNAGVSFYATAKHAPDQFHHVKEITPGIGAIWEVCETSVDVIKGWWSNRSSKGQEGEVEITEEVIKATKEELDFKVKMDYGNVLPCDRKPAKAIQTLITRLTQTYVKMNFGGLSGEERHRLWNLKWYLENVIMQERTIPPQGILCEAGEKPKTTNGVDSSIRRTYVKRFVFVAHPIPEKGKFKGIETGNTLDKHHEAMMKTALDKNIGAIFMAMSKNTLATGEKALNGKGVTEESKPIVGVVQLREFKQFMHKWYQGIHCLQTKKLGNLFQAFENYKVTVYHLGPNSTKLWIPGKRAIISEDVSPLKKGDQVKIIEVLSTESDGKVKILTKNGEMPTIEKSKLELIELPRWIATKDWQTVPEISRYLGSKGTKNVFDGTTYKPIDVKHYLRNMPSEALSFPRVPSASPVQTEDGENSAPLLGDCGRQEKCRSIRPDEQTTTTKLKTKQVVKLINEIEKDHFSNGKLSWMGWRKKRNMKNQMIKLATSEVEYKFLKQVFVDVKNATEENIAMRVMRLYNEINQFSEDHCTKDVNNMETTKTGDKLKQEKEESAFAAFYDQVDQLMTLTVENIFRGNSSAPHAYGQPDPCDDYPTFLRAPPSYRLLSKSYRDEHSLYTLEECQDTFRTPGKNALVSSRIMECIDQTAYLTELTKKIAARVARNEKKSIEDNKKHETRHIETMEELEAIKKEIAAKNRKATEYTRKANELIKQNEKDLKRIDNVSPESLLKWANKLKSKRGKDIVMKGVKKRLARIRRESQEASRAGKRRRRLGCKSLAERLAHAEDNPHMY